MTDPILASLRAAVRARPDDTALRMAIARHLLATGDLPGAMAEAAEALRADPSCAEARDFMLSALSAPPAAPADPPTAPSVQPPAVPSVAAEVPAGDGFDWSAAEQEIGGIVGPRFVEEGADDPGQQDAYETERPKLRLADVGGMESVKERLEVAFLAPMRNPELRVAWFTDHP